MESYIYKPFSEEPLIGEMKYPNEYLKSKGVKEGDLVTFLPETEYEFNIDGEKLYRMYDHHISMVLWVKTSGALLKTVGENIMTFQLEKKKE